jgi:2-dehydro-3-deoxygluconokinase
MADIRSPELILKLTEPACLLRFGGRSHEVKAGPLTQPVVDTTAAGDSFAAAYIAARLAGSDPIEAARAGHRLAGIVVCYPGAIIPRYAMPARKTPRPAPSRKASQ